MKPRDFREYKVWKSIIDFSVYVYRSKPNLPEFGTCTLYEHLENATLRISSHITDASRCKNVEFIQHLEKALGAAYEVETILLIANKSLLLRDNTYALMDTRIRAIEQQINTLITKTEKLL